MKTFTGADGKERTRVNLRVTLVLNHLDPDSLCRLLSLIPGVDCVEERKA